LTWTKGPFTWRYLIPLLLNAGYAAIAPELSGYGESQHIDDTFNRGKLCDSMVAILDAEGVRKAIIVGHDHGTFLHHWL
jgi:pimeloyl-ACP methyl ester carboxylesterase